MNDAAMRPTPAILDLLRGVSRTLWLGVLLLACCLHFLLTRPAGLRARVHWRQRWSRLVLNALGVALHVRGTVPEQGVLVGNHLSYLDILTYGAIIPAVFVGKQELRSWPVLGFITRSGGTIYIDRQNPRSAAQASRAIADALQQGLPVVFFPEGTSSDGSTILPLQSPLFQAPVHAGAAIWPAAIAYSVNGSVEGTGESICYWGSMTFGPHIARLLQLRRIAAQLHIAPAPVYACDRRTAAAACQGVMDDLFVQAKRAATLPHYTPASAEQTATA